MNRYYFVMAILMSALTASADFIEYKYDFYDLDLVPYDFEVNGIYYRFGTDIAWYGADWSNETAVSVTIGLTEVDKSTFAKSTYSYYTGDVVVPSTVTYEGVTYTVREVNAHAFAYNDNLRSVVLPNTVEVIGYGSLAYCTNLTSVRLPSNLRKIIQYAFYNSDALVDMPIPNSVYSIGQYAFSGCDNYVLQLPEKLEDVFDWGANMELSYPDGIVLSNSVKTVYEFPQVRRMTFADNITVDNPRVYPWIRGTNSYTNLPAMMEELVLPSLYFQLSTKLICGEKLERILLPEVEAFSVWSIGGIIWNNNPGEFVSMSIAPPAIEAARNPSLGDCYDATLVVPAGSEEAYRNAPVWCEFKTIRGDADIQRYLPGDTGGITAVVSEADDDVTRVYGLNGVYVGASTDGLAPGLYVVRRGSDCRKVTVR